MLVYAYRKIIKPLVLALVNCNLFLTFIDIRISEHVIVIKNYQVINVKKKNSFEFFYFFNF